MLCLFSSLIAIVLLLPVTLAAAMPRPSDADFRHGIAAHGEPALGPNFTHLPYADPDALIGGTLNLSAIGTFDSLNPLITKGTPAVGINQFVYESLLGRNLDEPFTLYGRVAEAIATPPDRSWVAFRLHPQAHFADGTALTADDVAYSLKALRERGRPNHRFYYSKIVGIEITSPHEIIFTFADAGDRELPLIVGLMPILPRHRGDANFAASLVPPLGSGPYRVSAVEPGVALTLERDPDYWGRDLPINRGVYNFDRIDYHYMRDATIALETFKSGLLDLLPIGAPARWREGLSVSAAAAPRLIRDAIPTGRPSGLFGFVFNTRKPIFSSRLVRKALSYVIDRQWLNRTLYYDTQTPINSYFDNSELTAIGHPATVAERDRFDRDAASVEPDILDGRTILPIAQGRGFDRRRLREAIAMLAEAGYTSVDGQQVRQSDGTPLAFTILTASPEQDRLALAYARNLAKIGVSATPRRVESSQYQVRLRNFDYDMILFAWPGSLSPGNEQYFRWSSKAADEDGSFNFAGVQSPAIDDAIDRLVAAHSRADLVAAARSLDRLIMSGYYVVPLLFKPTHWIARWDHIRRPAQSPLLGPAIATWWHSGEL